MLPKVADVAIFTDSIISSPSPDDAIVLPNGAGQVDYEGEIGVRIGRRAKAVTSDAAWSYVDGLLPLNDVTARTLQRADGQWSRAKGFDTFCPVGHVRPLAEIDLDALSVTTRLNGEVMQNATADLMVFGFVDLIEYCSTFIELVPGDVIVTGTPGGVGAARNPPVFMDAGDRIEVEVKPIGTLSHNVIVG